MATINPYLHFLGSCEEAFNFYKSVFGGEFSYVGRYDEMPENPEYPISETDKQKIMHISLPISQETVLMGSDTGVHGPPNNVVGNNISISAGATSKEEADRIFNRLAEGGKITMPIADMFWGDYFGMCTDKFDINWMVVFGPNS